MTTQINAALPPPKQIRFVNNQGQPPSKRRRINAAYVHSIYLFIALCAMFASSICLLLFSFISLLLSLARPTPHWGLVLPFSFGVVQNIIVRLWRDWL